MTLLPVRPILGVLFSFAFLAGACGSDAADSDSGSIPDTISLVPDDPDAPLAIAFGGFFHADGADDLRLCASLAESFPPQCADEVVMVVGSLDLALAQVRTELGDDAVNNEGDVWWTTEWVTLSGTLQANRLVLDS